VYGFKGKNHPTPLDKFKKYFCGVCFLYIPSYFHDVVKKYSSSKICIIKKKKKYMCTKSLGAMARAEF
jgi:hypothetical protein